MDRRTQIEGLISDRMKKLALMVTPGLIVVDIGCDHGFVSAYLVISGKSDKVIAADVAEGPLESAKKTFGQLGLMDKIETRLSDGFSEIKEGESECAVIAGMGGHLIMDIIEAGLPKLKNGYELILSPQSDVPEVRRFLRERRISILDEEMLIENEKYYNILKCSIGNATDEAKDDTIEICDSLPKEKRDDRDIYDMFGKALIEKKSPVLKQYLLSEIEKKQKIYCSLNKHCSGAPEEAPENILERLSEIDREIYLMGNTVNLL